MENKYIIDEIHRRIDGTHSYIDSRFDKLVNHIERDYVTKKNKIEKEIRRIVYGDDKVEKNPVVDDISTDIKPKRVRKSIKKES